MHKVLRLLLGTIILSCIAAAPLAAAQGNEPQFSNVPSVPVPEGMGYGGFFEKNQPVKLVFGVSDPGHQMQESLTNAAYTIKYLEPRGIPYEIQFVLYGRAVLPANEFATVGAGYAPLMEELNEYGVSFMVCNNSLAALKQSADDVYPYMDVIPAGILQIAKMQMQGFTYIANVDGVAAP